MAQPAAALPRLPARDGLLWTDWWFLLALAISLAVAVDPLGWRLAGHTVIKHLALLLGVPAAVLALALRAATPHAPQPPRGRRKPRPGPVLAPLSVAWPLALFALLAAGGSAYARLQLGVVNTFLVYGLYALLMFLAAAMVLQCRSPLSLLRAWFGVLLAAGLVMSAMLIVYSRDRQVYHEQIFLVIPLAALVFAAKIPFPARWAGAAFFLSMAWFSHKWTSYIVGSLAAFYLAAFLWLPRIRARDALGRLVAGYWAGAVLIGGVVAALAYALGRSQSGDPTGNLEYRLHTYGEAWQRFLASPLWGNGFTNEATEKFTLYSIGVAGNVLPTHSDVLDVLSNGGLLAAVLAAAGLIAIARLAWRRLLHPGALARPEAPYAHALALMSLAALAVCAFNPILLQPPMAALAWSNLGLLLGLALRTETA